MSVAHDNIILSHLVATNRDKSSWVFPKESIILPVEEEQILMASVAVKYHQSVRIRVSLDENLVNKASQELACFIKT